MFQNDSFAASSLPRFSLVFIRSVVQLLISCSHRCPRCCPISCSRRIVSCAHSQSTRVSLKAPVARDKRAQVVVPFNAAALMLPCACTLHNRFLESRPNQHSQKRISVDQVRPRQVHDGILYSFRFYIKLGRSLCFDFFCCRLVVSHVTLYVRIAARPSIGHSIHNQIRLLLVSS